MTDPQWKQDYREKLAGMGLRELAEEAIHEAAPPLEDTEGYWWVKDASQRALFDLITKIEADLTHYAALLPRPPGPSELDNK